MYIFYKINFIQAKTTGEVATSVSPDVMEHLHSVAAQLMEKETALFEESELQY